MFSKTFTYLSLAAALSVLGAMGIAHAQRNYTDGGNLYGGARAQAGASVAAETQKSGKFDPYTDGVRQSTRADLTGANGNLDPAKSNAKIEKFDPYTDGARTRTDKDDPYTNGTRVTAKGDQ